MNVHFIDLILFALYVCPCISYLYFIIKVAIKFHLHTFSWVFNSGDGLFEPPLAPRMLWGQYNVNSHDIVQIVLVVCQSPSISMINTLYKQI